MKSWIGLLFTFACSGSAFAITETAKVYEVDGDKKVHLFNFRREDEMKGPLKIIRTRYTNLDGTLAIHDETTIADGKLKKFVLNQAQLNQVSTIEINDSKVYYLHSEEGKTTSREEDLDPNYVVGPFMGEILKTNWKELLNGKDVDIRFAIPDRKETFGFTLVKEEHPEAPSNTVIIKMKAISFFVALVVRPFYMTFTKSDMKITRFKGMLLPKKNVDGRWKDIVGEIIYDK